MLSHEVRTTASTWRVIASIGVGQVGSLGFTLFTLIVTARELGPDGRGLLAATLSWATVFATVAGLSLGQALTHRMQHGGSAVPDAVHVGSLAAIAVGLGITGATLFWLCGVSGSIGSLARLPAALLMMGALWVPLGMWEPYAAACFGRAGRLREFARLVLVARACGAAALLVLLYVLELGAPGAFAAVLFSQALLGALALGTLVRWHGVPRARWHEARQLLPPGLQLHATTASALVIDAATLLVIFGSLTPADAGIYQLAQQTVAVLLIVPQAAGALLHSRLAAHAANADWPIHRKVLVQTLLTMLLAAVVLAILAPTVVRLIGGTAFAPAGDVVRLLLLTIFGPAMAMVLAPQWIGRGLFVANGVLTVGVAATLLGLTLAGVANSGLNGAVWARVVALGGLVVPVQLAFIVYVERRHRRHSGLAASTIRSS